MLGVSSAADSDAINRAYKNKLKAAGGDAAQKRAIEEAHSSILMSGLSSRLRVCTSTCVRTGIRLLIQADY